MVAEFSIADFRLPISAFGLQISDGLFFNLQSEI